MSNGTWMNWEQSYEIIKKLGSIKAINGKMSDTRAMAHIVGTKRKTSWLREITQTRTQIIKELELCICRKRKARV